MENYRSRSDQELIAGCLEGEEPAWVELIVRYKRLIYSVPFKCGLSAVDAADVFQTVCMILLENLHSLRDQSKISAWLVTTTARECWKVQRERRREQSHAELRSEGENESGLVDPAMLPDTLIGDLEEQHRVRQGLQSLDERCQRLLHYIFYQRKEISYKEISRILHMPESSIGPTRARCLGKLKKVLAKLGRR